MSWPRNRRIALGFVPIIVLGLAFGVYVGASVGTASLGTTSSPIVIISQGSTVTLASSGDHPGGHVAINLAFNLSAALEGSFFAYSPGQYPNGSAAYNPSDASVFLLTPLQFQELQPDNGTGTSSSPLLSEFVTPVFFVYSTEFVGSGEINN